MKKEKTNVKELLEKDANGYFSEPYDEEIPPIKDKDKENIL